MDPQETWRMLLDAWVMREWEEVDELAEALLNWLDRQGFPPSVAHPKELGADLNRAIVRAACEFIRQRTRSVLNDPNRIPQDVPFSLTCGQCNNQGPDTHEEALSEGWTGIEYVPDLMSENFLGICPICRAKNG